MAREPLEPRASVPGSMAERSDVSAVRHARLAWHDSEAGDQTSAIAPAAFEAERDHLPR